MNQHRSLAKLATLSLAIAAAVPAFADTTVTTVERSGTHHYVYYRDHDIYFSPETRTYYWLDNGRWQTGTELPNEYRSYVTVKGTDIDLDTERPYERNDQVVQRFRSDSPTSTTTTTERRTSDDGMTTTTTTTTTKHKYVFYGDHDIYFSPDTKTYFWSTGGRWHQGDALPVNMAPYVQSRGVNIELDTERPYERNDYVIEHYRQRDGE